MKFSDFLRQVRKDAGYTQQDIADMLGINRSTYAYYETGKTEPNIHHLKILSRLYKLHMEDFVSGRYLPVETGLHAEEADVETADTTPAQTFRSLNAKEKQLVALYRSFNDQEGFLQYVRKFEDND